MDAFDDGGSGDEFEDLELLEQIEAEALKQHAAAKQARAQKQHELTQQPALPTAVYTQLQNELESLRKLQRDQQGELRVLKDNHARSKVEQEEQMAKAAAAQKAAEEAANRQVILLQEENQRLSNAMTFQRQELRDARVRQAQQSPSKGSPLARRKADAAAFPPLADLGTRQSPTRKRKRARKGANDDEEMDFDQVQVAPVVRSPQKAAPRSPIPMPSPVRDMTPMMVDVPDVVHVQQTGNTGNVILTHKLQLCAMLCALQDESGMSLIHKLDQARESAHPSTPLITIINSHALFADASDMAIALMLSLGQCQSHPKALRFEAIRLMLLLLRSFPHRLAIAFCQEVQEPGVLQLMASPVWVDVKEDKQVKHLHRLRLRFFCQIAQALSHEPTICEQMYLLLGPAFLTFALAQERDTEDFVLAVRLLAALAHANAKIAEDEGLLNLLTAPLEPQSGRTSIELLQRQTLALQCLYALSIYQDSALEVFRSSRLLVPRLAACIYGQLELFYVESSRREELNRFLESCLRFYHLLLNDMEAGQAERHWLVPQARATHIVAMTRISFAEDEDAYSLDMIDMARDLLELCISPEEGEEIHAIL
ncbi:hypothetical protein BCR37DRAFT_376017, partial [Protomyces lactucae-debilis]